MSGQGSYRELGPSGRTLDIVGPVGFDRLPNQIVNYEISKGFVFNIMVVGETGVGKSSLMRTLFEREFKDLPTKQLTAESASIDSKTYELKEGPVNLKLRIFETVGFGDQLDKVNSPTMMIDFVESHLRKYLVNEMKTNRNEDPLEDSRIHLCLYLIPSTSSFLRVIDLSTMKKLSNRVNLIPIVSKADGLTKEELVELKKTINNQLSENEINGYQFPLHDPAKKERNTEMNKRLPFAVVSSNAVETIDGKPTRIRKYPWGVVKIDDESHNEFCYLREMVIKKNMSDLIFKTQTVHYEAYRLDVLMNDPQIAREIMNINAKESGDSTKNGAVLNQENYAEKIANLEKEYDEKLKKLQVYYDEQMNFIAEKKRHTQNLIDNTSENEKTNKAMKSKSIRNAKGEKAQFDV